MLNNQYIRLEKLSQGRPSIDQFSLQTEQQTELLDGEYLIENHFIAIDPALVGRLRQEDNYAERVEPGEVMHAYCVGRVIESRNDQIAVGQMRYGRFDMQQYKRCDQGTLSFPINTEIAPANYYLGVLGTTGATAYFALNDLCEPRRGECLVVSSAASSVGSIAGQLGRKAGCRTIGIVSTDDKAIYTQEEFGYDAVISYRGKSASELARELADVCPKGIDMYFDNTSGYISEALLDLYNDRARIAVVGRMALSNLEKTSDDIGRRDNSVVLSKRIKKQGFVVVDYLNRFAESAAYLKSLIDSGELKVTEDIVEGLENAPLAFMRVVQGINEGKQLVKLI